MNKEVADSKGIDYSKIDTEEELAPLLRKVKEMYPDMYPVGSNGGTMSTMSTTDDLGQDFGVLEDCTNPDDTTVVNWYATDAYKDIGPGHKKVLSCLMLLPTQTLPNY